MSKNSIKRKYIFQRVEESEVELDYEAIFKEIYKANIDVMNDEEKSWYYKTQFITDKFMLTLTQRIESNFSFRVNFDIKYNTNTFSQIMKDFTNYVETNFTSYHDGWLRRLGRSVQFI
jgi:hypothetical protein